MLNNLKTRTVFFILFIALILSVFFLKDRLLSKVATNLVYEDVLGPAQAIVVLAGSKSGNRLEEGIRLLKKDLGKTLVFSGFPIYPHTFTNQLMIEYAKSLGVSSDKIITKISNGESSTWGEAIANLDLLRQNGIHEFILVTSSFHTKRSHWVYQKLVSEMNLKMEFKVHPAKDPDIPIGNWWESRMGRKMILLEYLKTVAYYIEH